MVPVSRAREHAARSSRLLYAKLLCSKSRRNETYSITYKTILLIVCYLNTCDEVVFLCGQKVSWAGLELKYS